MLQSNAPVNTLAGKKTLEITVQALQSIVPPERISTAQPDLTQHSRDQSAFPASSPDIVIWPRATAEVGAILRYANEIALPVTAWGAGTSIEGNPIPLKGGIVLDFQQMDKIVGIHQHDFQATVQPGALYKDMNQELAHYGLFFAPDPGANASIGGMIANNAAGIRTVKYGATKDNVLAMEVVLANGEIIRTGSCSIKQSSGYDLTRLFVGSEGTLGIVTEATLKLAPLPEHYSAVVVAFPTVKEAAETVFDIIGSGLEPSALELLNSTCARLVNTEEGINLIVAPNLLMEFNGPSEAALQETPTLAEEICRDHHSQDFQAGIGHEARAQLWRARHSFFEIAIRSYPGQSFLLSDVAVPISRYPLLISYASEIMAGLDTRGLILGHAGDGNLHTIIFFSPDDKAAETQAQNINALLVKKALSLGGTSTGEHGVGIGKQKYMALEHGESGLKLMRQLKATLDPKGILNPGKVLDLS